MNELEADSDTDFLNLSVKVTIEGEKFGDLALEADINLSFVCKYRNSFLKIKYGHVAQKHNFF